LKNILYLTDFSGPSEASAPLAASIARSYGATVHLLHVLTPVIPASCPEAVQADEEMARAEMDKANSHFSDVPHQTTIAEGMPLWPAVEQAIRKHEIDLIVLGTHGRTGARKLLLGSVAEEVFRRSSVPVLTLGPEAKGVGEGGFQCVLLATDFGKASFDAAPYALSLAEENDARLVLLHVLPERGKNEEPSASVTDVLRWLDDMVPLEAKLWCRPMAVARYGDVAERVVETAAEHGADVIVLGVRAAENLGAATHLERAIAHKIVAQAPCPVLTVRG